MHVLAGILILASDQVFVWKEIEYGGMSEAEKEQLVREVNLLREFKHSNIVRYHDRYLKLDIKLYVCVHIYIYIYFVVLELPLVLDVNLRQMKSIATKLKVQVVRNKPVKVLLV